MKKRNRLKIALFVALFLILIVIAYYLGYTVTSAIGKIAIVAIAAVLFASLEEPWRKAARAAFPKLYK